MTLPKALKEAQLPEHKANEATKSPKGLKRRKGLKGNAVVKEKHFCPFGP